MLGDCVKVVVMTAWGDPPPSLITVMPAVAGKGHAALYVQERLGVRPQDCLCAGDTKGDEAMLITGLDCVCVGNSTQELLDVRDGLADYDLHYLAEAAYAEGVTEGLRRFLARRA